MSTSAAKGWHAVRARWQGLALRERRLVALATAIVVLAVLWWGLVGPALRILRQAPLEHARQQAALQQLQSLQARARALQAQPALSAADALRGVQDTATLLGAAARVQVQGDRVTLQLQAVPAPALSQWLQALQGPARLQPQTLQLQRDPGAATWSGRVEFRLPAAPSQP